MHIVDGVTLRKGKTPSLVFGIKLKARKGNEVGSTVGRSF